MTALDVARDYLARGWCPVPVPIRKKRPVLDAWQTLRLTPDQLPRAFPGASNVGIILGEPSHGLADVDLDCLEAIELAPQLLPATATFGRQSKPASHWLYRAPGATTRQYKAFGETLVELRSGTGGHQTVFPGSVHECGEPIRWTDPSTTTPADVPVADLARAVARLAVACLIARHSQGHLAAFLADPYLPPQGLPGDVDALAREWLGMAVSRPAKPTTKPTRALERFEEARRAFNADNPMTATKRGRACPAEGCEGKNSYKGDQDKATCFHSSHPHTCGTRCAGSGAELYVFDALDLAAHNAGRTPREHLEAAGYWTPARLAAVPSQPAPSRQPGEDDGPAAAPHTVACASTPPASPMVPIGESIDAAAEMFRRRRSGEERPLPLPWACASDLLGGGLWPGAHVLTGTTAAGKTAFAVQASVSSAAAGHPVLYIGLELDTAQIIARLASMLLGEHDGRPAAHWSDIYLGKVDPPMEALEQLRGLPIYVEEAPPGGWSARSMDARVKELRLRHQGVMPLVVLDFLQLVGPSEPGGRREELRERIGAAAYAGRQVARTHGAVVLMLSSISRAGATELQTLATEEQLGVCDPRDLVGLGKESGDIEYSADSVLVLAREQVPEDAPKSDSAPVWLAVAKVRAGRPGWGALRFNGSWLEQESAPSRKSSAEDRQEQRRAAKAKADEERRAREYEGRLGRILKVLEGSKQPLSVHFIATKTGSRPAGFSGLLQDLENRGLAHQVWFGRKSLGWAIGAPTQDPQSAPAGDPFPSVPIRSGNARERTGTVCVPTPLYIGAGTHPGSHPAAVAETGSQDADRSPPESAKPAPTRRPILTPDEHAALIARAAQPDEYLEAMAAQVAPQTTPAAPAQEEP